MSARPLLGKPVIAALDAETAARASALRARGLQPTLATVRVGGKSDDVAYEKNASRRAEDVGLAVRRICCGGDVTQDELLGIVEELNADASVHGVLMLRPLPAHLDEHYICNMLSPSKDVDGTTVASSAGTFTGEQHGFAPCTAQACIEILEYYGVALAGKRALVVGRSLVAGKPVAMMLLERDATVTIAHSRTAGLAELAREADIVIAAVGRAGLLGAEHMRAGQYIVDVGINFAEGGGLVGDVDYERALAIVDGVTPVPGGVGGVTTSVLCRHVVQAAQRILDAGERR